MFKIIILFHATNNYDNNVTIKLRYTPSELMSSNKRQMRKLIQKYYVRQY